VRLAGSLRPPPSAPPPFFLVHFYLSPHSSACVYFTAMADVIELDPYQAACMTDYRRGKNVGVFSSAGGGKSVVLRAIITHAVGLHGASGVGICSWYGAAADLIGGQTLHSLFACGVRRLEPSDLLQLTRARFGVAAKLRRIRVLIIDEVFTMTAGWLALFLHVIRGLGTAEMQTHPAGGVQVVGMFHVIWWGRCRLLLFFLPSTTRLSFSSRVAAPADGVRRLCASPGVLTTLPLRALLCYRPCVVAGDPMQTLPVDLSPGAADRVVFDCLQWRSLFRAWRGSSRLLLGNHRHADDAAFATTLERIRLGQHEAADIAAINQTWHNFTEDERQRMPHLRAVNVTADAYNKDMMEALPGPSFRFDAVDEVLSRSPTEVAEAEEALGHTASACVIVRLQAPVIARRRISPTIPTGTVGTVVEVLSSFECICLFKGERVRVVRKKWEVFNKKGDVTATRMQLPILLAWAVTIHRAQGSELERVCIDLSKDQWACDGLVYTALSRVRSFRGLCVRGLTASHIKTSTMCLSFWDRLVQSMASP